MESIETSTCGKPEDCMQDLLGRWTSNQAGNRDPPSHLADDCGGSKENRIWSYCRKLSMQAWTDSVTVTVCHLATVSYTADDIVTCSCHHCAV